jgi:hypothetical protein
MLRAILRIVLVAATTLFPVAAFDAVRATPANATPQCFTLGLTQPPYTSVTLCPPIE